MAKTKPSFYAVHKGKQPGIYRTWAECEAQVNGHPGAKYRGFVTESEARTFLMHGTADVPTSAPLPTSAVPASSIPASTSSTSSYNTSKIYPQLPIDTPTAAASSSSAQTYVDEKPGTLVVYTDGACKGNGKDDPLAGVGVWWGPNHPDNIAERCPGDQTNNRAELIAISRALETAAYDKPLVVKTDSKYSRDCFGTWIHNWKKRGWLTASGEPIKNKAVIKYVAAMLDGRSALGQKVELIYVKAHVGIQGNEGADMLANRGAMCTPLTESDWKVKKKKMLQEMERVKQERGRQERAPVVLSQEEIKPNGQAVKVESTQIPLSAFPPNSVGSVEVGEIDWDEFSADDLLDDDDLARELAEGY